MPQPYMVHSRAEDAELYRRFAPALLAYLLRNVASREDAEDLLVDIFLAALEKRLSAGIDEQKFSAWIWIVAHNKVVDYHRRHKHRKSKELYSVQNILYESTEQEPEQMALKNEEYQQLHLTLRELSKVQRDIVQLRFGHDLTCGQIAAVIHKSEGAVRMTLHRTLKLLRTLYSRNEEGGKL
ncbi:RNA polymerase sigma factor [Ktedonosporobacter rubrisoli]|uniref:RNA polymerase sigma factor n=1 Tax=Ktedonosporobacter rubrisoli TaxID=2509675 RepID=A0A4P6JI60_KTERU|nr:RNA polymerase sigma factor [Ktedonosporobacter rubrisoli]QBD74737.1 RNA polymerase sigma factor [Ktedonosporobacter rubrisoli]